MSETTADELPPENGPFVEPPNPLDNLETELPPTNVGTPAEIQAMLEAPTGIHVVEDGAGGFTTVETAPATEPGVDPAYAEPMVLQEEANRVVLQSATGTQTVGERP